jgi:hypothetical protein
MIVGFELKALILILGIISFLICISQYKEVWKDKRSYLFGTIETYPGFTPKRAWWIWLLITFAIFAYALYLNEQSPIILF